MNVDARVASETQLVRLLQVGVVLEEVFEARAQQHYRDLSTAEREAIGEAVATLLAEAEAESAEHRRRLEALIEELDAETVGFERIQTLVADQYDETRPEDFDGVLYDLIDGIESSEAEFGVSRERLLETLEEIREEEAEGVASVTRLMQEEDQ